MTARRPLPITIHGSDSEPSSDESDVEIISPAPLRHPGRLTAPLPRSSQLPNPSLPPHPDDHRAFRIAGLSPPSSQRERETVFIHDPAHPLWDRPEARPYPPGPDGSAEAPKATLAGLIDVGPDEPMARQGFSFDPDQYGGGTAHAPSLEEMMSRLGEDEEERMKWEVRLEEEWQKAKEMPGELPPWGWEQVTKSSISTKCKGDGRILRRVVFFPWFERPGLTDLRNVFAIVGGDKVFLCKLDPPPAGSSSSSQPRPSKDAIKLVDTLVVPNANPNEPEMLRACEFGLDLRYEPPIPLLFAAGAGKIVYVVQLLHDQKQAGKPYRLALERSISGQGRTIWDLSVVPNEPNIVIAAGEDCAPAMYDATVPGGSNRETSRQYAEASANRNKKGNTRPKARGVARIKPASAGAVPIPKQIVRPKVEGELLGKFTGKRSGHLKGVLSVAVHPVMPLVVTGGLDGRVCVWDLPGEEERGEEVEFDGLMFRSHRVHSGQWVDQVEWAAPDSVSIISKSTASNADSPWYRSKTVLHWTPHSLDPPAELYDPAHVLPPKGELAYRLEQRAEWPDQDVVGDRFGVYHVYDAPGVFDETLVAVPVGPSKRLSGEVVAPAVAVMASDSVRRDVLPDGRRPETMEEMVEAMFPKGRERPMYDMTPRWRVEDWVDVEEKEKEKDGVGNEGGGRKGRGKEVGVRLRGVGVSGDGEWMVGVGNQGVVVVWRRVERVDVKEEKE